MATAANETMKRPKRGHGEGSIRERKDRGDWRGEIMLGTKPAAHQTAGTCTARPSGWYRTSSVSFASSIRTGCLPDAAKGRETVAAFLTSWLDSITGTMERAHSSATRTT